VCMGALCLAQQEPDQCSRNVLSATPQAHGLGARGPVRSKPRTLRSRLKPFEALLQLKASGLRIVGYKIRQEKIVRSKAEGRPKHVVAFACSGSGLNCRLADEPTGPRGVGQDTFTAP
jgi:hypothetical protein